MLYTFVDWQRRLIEPWLDGLRLGSEVLLWQRLVMAQQVLLKRAFAAADGAPAPIEAAVARDHPGVSSAETVLAEPFFRLVRLRAARNGPPILVVAPCSGYAGAVLGELAAGLLPAGEVYFLDWTDARHIPPAFGPMGLIEQLALVLRAIDAVGAPAHLIGISQSGAVTLAAASLAMAAGNGLPAPLSLSLLGAPIGQSARPAAADWLFGALEHAGLGQCLITTVPDRYPGAGRRVYPGLLQLLAVAATNPRSYLETQAGFWAEIVTGGPGRYDRLHADLHRVADVPAELFVETVEQLRRRPAWSADGLCVGQSGIPTAGLANLPILTIEAAGDELVGAGSTHVAVALGGSGSGSFTLPDATHHALFTGPAFAVGVAPRLRRFIAESS